MDWSFWGTVPQWITALIAAAAGGIAIYSICTQRSIARKRAAVDAFIKTEMDQKMIEAYDDFHAGLRENKKGQECRRVLHVADFSLQLSCDPKIFERA